MAVLQLDDVALYYEVAGQGEPLLLIHGLGSSTRDWELQVPVFAEHMQVVTYDVRGHGRSGKPPGPYNVRLFARDAAALVQALDIASAHIAGISMGGMIGLQLAVDAPELVRSLVVVNAPAELVVRTWKDRLSVWQRHLIAQLLGMRTMGRVLARRMFPEPGQEAMRQMFVERWAENDAHAWRAALDAIVGWSVTHRLEEICCPVLVVAGDQDTTPVATKRAYAARIPDARVAVVSDSRHGTPVDQPERFNETVLSFLSEQSRARL